MHLKIKIPIKTVSEANKATKRYKIGSITKYKAEHWTETAKRHRLQKSAVRVYLNGKIDESWLPCLVTITRIAPRKLDHRDNLPMSQKWICDAICELLIPGKATGHADSDNRIQVKYEQIKGIPKEYAIEVEIRKND